MSIADLQEDLKFSLRDSAEVFDEEDAFARLLRTAALAFNDERPRTLFAEVSILMGVDTYPAPANMYRYKAGMWGRNCRLQTWDPGWPGAAPDFVAVEEDSGNGPVKLLRLDAMPTYLHLQAFGSTFGFYYLASHHIDEQASKTTISPGDRDLLILRAQAEAMREMVMRNIKKPVQQRDGLNSAPKNMTPSAFYDKLMEEWTRRVRRLAA